MKLLVAILLLLASLSPAWSMSTKERSSIGENRIEARRAAKQHQKITNKAANKQRKQLKKYQKARRRAIKNAQRQRGEHRYKH
jgi:hypothetical protein